MADIIDIIAYIENDLTVRGLQRPPPASHDAVARLQSVIVDQYAASLPQEFVDFLLCMDGVCISELTVGGTEARPVRYADGTPHRGGVMQDSILEMIDLFHLDGCSTRMVPVMTGGGRVFAWDVDLRSWCVASETGAGVIRRYRNWRECLVDAIDTTGREVQRLAPIDFQFTSLDEAGQTKFGAWSKDD